MPRSRVVFPALLTLLIVACGQGMPPEPPVMTVLPSAPPPAAQEPLEAFYPTNTPQSLPTPDKTPTGAPEGLAICSPISGMNLDALGDAISNPYNPPALGSDNPHQGIDLADVLPDTGIAIGGRAVNTILTGKIAAVLRGEFPFGYGVIIESTLSGIIQGVPELPTPFPEIPLHTSLSCPGVTDFDLNFNERSLYVLYAHLEEPVVFSVGDPAVCGAEIGRIGDSGNAANPHLHLEVRVGPSNLHLDGMSHYDPSATNAEMDAYCLWRVSGLYQLVDPVELILGK